MKSLSRIIIEHINHNPQGRDASNKLNEEFVVLENAGTEKISLAGWTLTDETATGARRHIYKFPQTVSLSSREKAYVHTGSGEDLFEEGKPSKWILHWGKTCFRLEQRRGYRHTLRRWRKQSRLAPSGRPQSDLVHA